MNPHDETLLNDLLDGRLDESAARDVRSRLETDAALAEAWNEMRRLRALLRRDDGHRAPASFLSSVRQRIHVGPLAPDDSGADLDRPDEGTSARGGGLLRLLPWLAAAAALLVAAGLLFLPPSGEAPPATESARVLLDEYQAPGERRARGYADRVEARDGKAAERSGIGALGRTGSEAGPEDPAAASAARPVEPQILPGGVFHAPGDSVPPGLRVPSDIPWNAEPASPALAAPASPVAAGASTVYLEAASVEAGRARLAALLLEARERTARHELERLERADEEGAPSAPPAPPAFETEDQAASAEPLATIWLTLSPAELAFLEEQTRPERKKAASEPPGAPAPEAVQEESGPRAEDAPPSREPQPSPTDARRVRVRVVLVPAR